MPLQATFTRHSMLRVRQRAKIDMSEIAALLDENCCIDVWRRPGSARNARLIYSIDDDAHFIVIQHELTGEVVTILYADNAVYTHNNFTNMLTEDMLGRARDMAISARQIARYGAMVPPTVYLVKVLYPCEAGYMKAKKLLSVPREKYGHSVDRMINDSAFLSTIRQLMLENAISIESSVLTIGDVNPKRPPAVSVEAASLFRDAMDNDEA